MSNNVGGNDSSYETYSAQLEIMTGSGTGMPFMNISSFYKDNGAQYVHNMGIILFGSWIAAIVIISIPTFLLIRLLRQKKTRSILRYAALPTTPSSNSKAAINNVPKHDYGTIQIDDSCQSPEAERKAVKFVM